MLKPLYNAGLLLTAALFLAFISSSFKLNKIALLVPQLNHFTDNRIEEKKNKENNSLYDTWSFSGTGLSKNAFDLAYKGYEFLKQKGALSKINILTIIDFSKSSAQQRLFVVDMLNGKILLQSLVAHGRNSGEEYASHFSNDNKSHQSSLGFYITRSTYIGSHGYSLRLEGCEKGINDAAYARDIVMHPTDYVSENFIRSKGYIGRSFGCPAVPESSHKQIIDLVKSGSCLFIYHPTETYLAKSKILNG